VYKIKTVEAGYARVEVDGVVIGTMTRDDFTGFWRCKMTNGYAVGSGDTRKLAAEKMFAMHERFQRG